MCSVQNFDNMKRTTKLVLNWHPLGNQNHLQNVAQYLMDSHLARVRKWKSYNGIQESIVRVTKWNGKRIMQEQKSYCQNNHSADTDSGQKHNLLMVAAILELPIWSHLAHYYWTQHWDLWILQHNVSERERERGERRQSLILYRYWDWWVKDGRRKLKNLWNREILPWSLLFLTNKFRFPDNVVNHQWSYPMLLSQFFSSW